MEPLTYEQKVNLLSKLNTEEHRAKKRRARKRAIVQKASRKANRRR